MRTARRLMFADIVALDDEAIDLATAALLIATDEYPGLDVQRYIDDLDQMAGRAREAASGLVERADILLAINSILFVEYGYSGNRQNYYDPRNSYLNQVIDRRTGIPITLSIIYMAVADRVGLRLAGVGMPGHFLVKHEGPSGDLFLDPFNGGSFIDAAGCARLVADISGGQLELRAEHLSAVGNKHILTRVLANLLGIYSEGNDFARAIRTVDLILAIHPNQADYIRNRGFLLAEAGRDREAIESLEKYLRLSPDTPDASEVRARIKDVKARLSMLN